MSYTDIGGPRSRVAALRQQLSDCNRTIAELKGRLKERDIIAIELRKLLREVMVANDPRRPDDDE